VGKFEKEFKTVVEEEKQTLVNGKLHTEKRHVDGD
jgi:hypothetical protein